MKKDKVFYQSKFEHYRVMNMWIVIASCISSLLRPFQVLCKLKKLT